MPLTWDTADVPTYVSTQALFSKGRDIHTLFCCCNRATCPPILRIFTTTQLQVPMYTAFFRSFVLCREKKNRMSEYVLLDNPERPCTYNEFMSEEKVTFSPPRPLISRPCSLSYTYWDCEIMYKVRSSTVLYSLIWVHCVKALKEGLMLNDVTSQPKGQCILQAGFVTCKLQANVL
jgi:hypothetical protein